MNSNLPILSSRKPSNSRIPSISSSIQRPSLLLKKNTHQITLSGIKRSRNDVPFDAQSPFNKFKRSTPLSLRKFKLTHLDAKEFNQPDTKLDLSDAFLTPSISKNVPPLLSVSKIPTIKKSIINIASSSTEDVTIEKRYVESKATSPIVDWKVITKESEIISYKVRINVLQKEIDELQYKNSKLRIDNEVNETKLRNEIDESKNKIKELNNEINSLKDNEEKLKYEFEEFQKIHLEQSKCIDKQKVENEKEISNLKEELYKIKSEEEKCRSKLSMDTLNFKNQINLLQSELDQVRMENQVYCSNFHNFELKNKEMESIKNELKNANAKNEQLENELKSYQEGNKLESILHGELNQLKVIKDENIHLRNKMDLLSQVHDENVVLKEKIVGHETTIKLLNQQLNKKNIDLHELESNKDKLLKWTQIVGIDSPDAVLNKINILSEKVSLLNVENDILKSEIKTLKEKISNGDYLTKSYELNFKKTEEKIKNLNEQLEQANKKCLFLNKEKDYYKKMASVSENSNKDEAANNNNRINELESIVDEYKAIVSKLEEDLQKTREELHKDKLKDKENEGLKNEIKRIKELNPHICTNVSMLDASTLQTSEDKFRIIHLQDNPLSIEIKKRAEELNKFKEENQRLKCLVEILERGDANNADITRQIDEAIQYRFEVEKLKSSLIKAEKQFKNLKQVFKKNCDAFRLACMELTGYQIDNISKNRYRLRHKYAFKNEFHVEIDGNSIKLFEDSTTEKLHDKIQLYLNKHGSYPAFFASYTLELFNDHTFL